MDSRYKIIAPQPVAARRGQVGPVDTGLGLRGDCPAEHGAVLMLPADAGGNEDSDLSVPGGLIQTHRHIVSEQPARS